MKKLIVLFVLAVAATGSALAQSSYVFVDSEAIFKSLDDYNAAIKQLDDLSIAVTRMEQSDPEAEQ